MNEPISPTRENWRREPSPGSAGARKLLPSPEAFQSWSAVKIPRSLNAWVNIATGLFIMFTLGVAFVPWTQTVTAQGQLSSYSPYERPQEIHAPISGRIRTWHVNEGTQVSPGDLLLELDDVDPRFMAPDMLFRLDQSRKALEERREAALSRAELLRQQINEMSKLSVAATTSAQARVSETENRIRSVEQRLAAAKVAAETASLNLDRTRLLQAEGLVSKRELELAIQQEAAAQAELNSAQATVQEVQQARQALSQGRKQIDAELVQRLLETRSQRASALSEAAKASEELADLELMRSNAMQRRAASQITAPIAGTIVRMARVGPSEVVHTGDPVLTIVPLSATRAVKMWADPLDAPLLTPGRRVLLLFQGIPAIPLPAWPELMTGTFDGKIQVVDQSPDLNGKFRFWVAPDPTRRPWPSQDQIRQGSQVMGWVILNRVPLWYELWRRFNLFPPDYQDQKTPLPDVYLPKAGRPSK